MTKQQLHEFVQGSNGNEKNICQIYALKNGEPAFEDCWHGYKTEDAVNINSVTKGVMALLFGIAKDKGFITGVEQRVLEFYPDYAVKRGEKTIFDVKLRHLLTMTAPYKFRSEPWTKVCTSEDWTKAALDLLGGKKGITGEFRYTSLGLQILTGVIERASGMNCIDFANKFLFTPLGIPQSVSHGDSSKEDQFDFLMNKDPRKHEWYCEPKGSPTAGWGLTLSAKDMARLGQLVLSGGEYCGKRVVSQDWLTDMTSPHIELGERFGYMIYGYLWYRPHKDREVFAAIGDGGNIIYADKEKGISVGVTGTFKPRIFDRVEFIEKRVVPLI